MLLVVGLGLIAAARPGPSETDDRLELVELTHRYAWAIDTVDRALLSRVFTPDARAHYVEVGPEVLGLDVRLEGFDEIWDWLYQGLAHREGPAGLPWHFMSNHLIEIDGDEARLRYYMHNRPLAAGGVYYADAVRTKDGWRIARLRLEEQTWKPEAYAGRPKPEMKRGGEKQ
jgi:hypothetical protein